MPKLLFSEAIPKGLAVIINLYLPLQRKVVDTIKQNIKNILSVVRSAIIDLTRSFFRPILKIQKRLKGLGVELLQRMNFESFSKVIGIFREKEQSIERFFLKEKKRIADAISRKIQRGKRALRRIFDELRGYSGTVSGRFLEAFQPLVTSGLPWQLKAAHCYAFASVFAKRGSDRFFLRFLRFREEIRKRRYPLYLLYEKYLQKRWKVQKEALQQRIHLAGNFIYKKLETIRSVFRKIREKRKNRAFEEFLEGLFRGCRFDFFPEKCQKVLKSVFSNPFILRFFCFVIRGIGYTIDLFLTGIDRAAYALAKCIERMMAICALIHAQAAKGKRAFVLFSIRLCETIDRGIEKGIYYIFLTGMIAIILTGIGLGFLDKQLKTLKRALTFSP